MKRKSLTKALCSAIAIDVTGGDVPEWVHLLPAGEIRTIDGRGPYRVTSMHSVAGLLPEGKKLPIDEMHATDKGAALGLPAPARGWIVALQAREDGLWGKVEWTGTGQQLMADKAYSGISPVILHSKSGEVVQLLRASLTNTPNLQGLTSLHSEEEGSSMDWKAKLIELLGLDSEADDDAIMAALKAKTDAATVALQSQQIDASHPLILAMQSELTDITTRHNTFVEGVSRKEAVSFVDAEIKRGRVGLKPMRDTYISMHMENSERTEKLIGAMPVLSGVTETGELPSETDAKGLDATDREIIALMGVDEDEYLAGLAPRGVRKEVL